MRGTGSIYQRSDGVWTAAVSMGVVDGKRSRIVVYGPDPDAVESKLHRMQLLAGGGGIIPSKEPVGSYLDAWAETRTGLAPHTAAQYRRVVAAMPGSLRAVPLGRLNTAHVQRWLDTLAVTPVNESDDEHPPRMPSPRTVQVARNILRAALNDAMRAGLVERNAAALARPPRQRRPKRTVITGADAAAILAAMTGWRYHAAVAVAIGCGLRQGELLALAWDDVTPAAITVRSTLHREGGAYVLRGTKTEASEARVPVPAFVAAALVEWDAIQAGEWSAAHPGVALGDRKRGPVFTTPTGRMVNGSALTHQFQARLEAEGLPKIAWHDLRHATADLLAGAGNVDQATTRDYLRHASVVTTKDRYTGTSWASLAAAAVILDRVVVG